YKGYFGKTFIDEEAKLIHGELQGLRGVITFQGKSVEEAESAFHDSVDDYLDWCANRGKEPEKPFSGRFNVRIDPGLHAKAAVAASRLGISLNRFVEKAIEDEAMALA
ncbi:MAG: type II toxin-antitoxin system HicB family antitoxin, partial [Spirochaetota bacterium]